jgi:hypothetical protein
MSLADLRKELKDLRKKAMPTPVSRMKKTECVSELERLKGIHSKEVKDVKEVVEKAEVPKKVAKKVEAIQKKAHEKGEEAVKKTKGVKAPKESVAEVKVPTTADKPKKESKAGSEEMKARMAKLREMRKKKD